MASNNDNNRPGRRRNTRSAARLGQAVSDDTESSETPPPASVQHDLVIPGEQMSSFLAMMQEIIARMDAWEPRPQPAPMAEGSPDNGAFSGTPIREAAVNPVFSPEEVPLTGNSSGSLRVQNAPCNLANKQAYRVSELSYDGEAANREGKLTAFVKWKKQTDIIAGIVEEANMISNSTSNAAWIVLLDGKFKNSFVKDGLFTVLKESPNCLSWNDICRILMEAFAGARYRQTLWQLYLRLEQGANEPFAEFLSYFNYLANLCEVFAADHHFAAGADLRSIPLLTSKLNYNASKILDEYYDKNPEGPHDYNTIVNYFRERMFDSTEVQESLDSYHTVAENRNHRSGNGSGSRTSNGNAGKPKGNASKKKPKGDQKGNNSQNNRQKDPHNEDQGGPSSSGSSGNPLN